MMILPSHMYALSFSNSTPRELVNNTLEFLYSFNSNDVKATHKIVCPLCGLSDKSHGYIMYISQWIYKCTQCDITMNLSGFESMLRRIKRNT